MDEGTIAFIATMVVCIGLAVVVVLISWTEKRYPNWPTSRALREFGDWPIGARMVGFSFTILLLMVIMFLLISFVFYLGVSLKNR